MKIKKFLKQFPVLFYAYFEVSHQKRGMNMPNFKKKKTKMANDIKLHSDI